MQNIGLHNYHGWTNQVYFLYFKLIDQYLFIISLLKPFVLLICWDMGTLLLVVILIFPLFQLKSRYFKINLKNDIILNYYFCICFYENDKWFNWLLKVNAISQFLSSEHIKAPVFLIGRSYGGKVAVEVAKRIPSLVSSLILVAPAIIPSDIHSVC